MPPTPNRNRFRPGAARRAGFLLLLAPILAIGLVACNTEGDDDDVTPTATLSPEEQKRQVAERVGEAVCPEESHDACVRQFLVFAEGDRQLALCVAEDGAWVYEPARSGRGIGDPCSDPAALIYAIVGAN